MKRIIGKYAQNPLREHILFPRRIFMGEIVENIFENQLYYKNTVILTYKIKYPELVRSRYRLGAQKFNFYNYEKAIKLAKYCETELFEEAKTLYDYNNSKGFPVMVYEVILDYAVTYQNHAIVSLYTDEYIFSGRSPWKHKT